MSRYVIINDCDVYGYFVKRDLLISADAYFSRFRLLHCGSSQRSRVSKYICSCSDKSDVSRTSSAGGHIDEFPFLELKQTRLTSNELQFKSDTHCIIKMAVRCL